MPQDFIDDVDHGGTKLEPIADAVLTEAEKAHKLVPEWATIELCAYVVSDSTGVNTRISLKGRTHFDAPDWDALLKGAVGTLNEMIDVTDTRPMTADEVREYLESEDEQKQSQSLHLLSDADAEE